MICVPPLEHFEILTMWGIIGLCGIAGAFVLGKAFCWQEGQKMRFMAEQLRISSDALRANAANPESPAA